MEKATFWVEIHGLPTPYLVGQNSSVIGAKVGEFIASDGADNRIIARRGFLTLKVDIMIEQQIPAGFYLSINRGRKEWIQFKYRKLPKICFNCGYIAHDSSSCPRNRAFAFPPVGSVVPLYGLWIKASVPIRSCFDTKGPVLICEREAPSAALQDNLNNSREGNIARHPMNLLGKNPADERVILTMMAHVGPVAAQMIKVPHEIVCKSRTPHHHLEPTIVIRPVEEGSKGFIGPLLKDGKIPNEPNVSWFQLQDSSCITDSKSKKRKGTGNVSPIIIKDPNSDTITSKVPDAQLNLGLLTAGSFVLGKDTSSKSSGSKKKSGSQKKVCNKATRQPNHGPHGETDVWWQPWIPWLDYASFRDLMESIRPKAPSLKNVADLIPCVRCVSLILKRLGTCLYNALLPLPSGLLVPCPCVSLPSHAWTWRISSRTYATMLILR
ncbi:hypothetical protein G4B88_007397 [Cannabis sativa]|uniref:Zinc knuckle CX2CX4HX4C domain-containing protein n=1 Tax=Cannabis sativa TaxID=3483 RepID=A0A7J6DS65_CANSA|nr:hypothetical protein G4B88_007397 [Cannabis sativa]